VPLTDDLKGQVKKIFREQWSKRVGRVVPSPADLALGNDAVTLEATILYADMDGSTQLVDSESRSFAAEIYKSYLACAARIIKSNGGTITAYDGDRVMAVFIGDTKDSIAVQTAMQIRWAVSNIVNPAIKEQYSTSTYQLRHTIGIDTSEIQVSRIGVRNDNDLVWVGRAANYAAKLSNLPSGYVYITDSVFKGLNDNSKYSGADPRKLMWEARTWKAMNDMSIYRSSWTWKLK